MNPLLSEWILPILVGAVIGYVTNAIAIKMLFRPLTEKRIGPFRVPFTPGVIPRQRHKFAASLSRVVTRELLSPDVIRGHLSRLDAAKRLEHAIARNLEALARRSVRELWREHRDLIHGSLQILGYAARSWMDRLWSIPLREVLQADRLETPLRALLEHVFPAFRQELGNWLRSPGASAELNRLGRLLLSRILDDLSPVQRLLVRSLGYDQRIRESMPALVETTVNRLLVYFDTPGHRADFLDRVAAALGQIVRQDLDGRTPDEVGEGLGRGREGPTLGGAASRLLGVAEEDLRTRLRAWVGSETEGLTDLFERTLEENAWTNEPIGELMALPSDLIPRVAAGLGETLSQTVAQGLPEFLEGFDVQKMLEDRVNSMDIATVESLLLQIMKRNFRWINLFGAVLGALLGLAQGLWRLMFH